MVPMSGDNLNPMLGDDLNLVPGNESNPTPRAELNPMLGDKLIPELGDDLDLVLGDHFNLVFGDNLNLEFDLDLMLGDVQEIQPVAANDDNIGEADVRRGGFNLIFDINMQRVEEARSRRSVQIVEGVSGSFEILCNKEKSPDR